ncbi:DUF2933 domain-containing protein [Klebsiella aerogenes]|nr:DUF2933 domain-containing protein [Proteus mirabilis]EKY0566971.1 DUF2933 domain-containing protein [Klebsiella aerogenes]EKZ2513204.1 DUF2933 domain-containing protein [Klebsiella pneumoniae]EKU7615437.1 DUF2933 domain-containing protein [Proteus mirabilis]EKU7615456.1 DUF2933 domain-containing protein [Proteus mirabilis]
MACNHEQHDGPNFWRSRTGIGFIVMGAVAGYFLVTEHWAHVVGFLPYLLLLACPLMHIFMHGGHGGHGGRDENGEHKRHAGCCGHHAEDPKKDRESQPPEQREKPSDKGESS